MSIVDSASLKDLQGRLEKEKAALKVAEIAAREAKERVSYHHEQIKKFNAQIAKFGEKKGLIMTEHAILRYIERVELVPPEEVEAKVVDEELKRLYSILGDGTYPIYNKTNSCVIKGGQIITII